MQEKELFANKVCPKNCGADCKECELADKKLKALEIIVRKKVNMQLLIESIDLDFYNSHWFMKLYQEEFNLLKEVLPWVKKNSNVVGF